MRSALRLRSLNVSAALLLCCCASAAWADSLQGRVLAGRSLLPAAGAQGGAAKQGAGAPGTDGGVSGVQVTIVDQSDPKSVFATRTGADGRFELDGIPAGVYRVTLSHSSLGRRSMQAMVGAGAGELEFVWETAPGPPPERLAPPDSGGQATPGSHPGGDEPPPTDSGGEAAPAASGSAPERPPAAQGH